VPDELQPELPRTWWRERRGAQRNHDEVHAEPHGGAKDQPRDHAADVGAREFPNARDAARRDEIDRRPRERDEDVAGDAQRDGGRTAVERRLAEQAGGDRLEDASSGGEMKDEYVDDDGEGTVE